MDENDFIEQWLGSQQDGVLQCSPDAWEIAKAIGFVGCILSNSLDRITNQLEQIAEELSGDDTGSALRASFISPNVRDSNGESANVVDTLEGIAISLGRAIRSLGNADASTPMGGMEAMGKVIMESTERLASAIERTCEDD